MELVPLRERDFYLLHQWFQDPVIEATYARGQTFTLEDIHTKYRPRLSDPNVHCFIVYEDNLPIGFIQYYLIPAYLPEGCNQKTMVRYDMGAQAGIDVFIAERDYRGCGYFQSIFDTLLTTYLRHIQLETVWVDPRSDNANAIRAFQKAGFTLEFENAGHSLLKRLLKQQTSINSRITTSQRSSA